jgi:EAL domain-containing protein (putative c-di-GMP-specific phosphodiesterase class I)/ActR/RegA family two-component response regulator
MSQRYDDFGDIAVDPITGLHRLGANGPSLATAIAVAGATKRRIDGAGLAERLRDAFETPLSIPPYTLPVTLSIGIAVFPEHAPDAATLLSKAEEALRRVKQDGLNNVGLYSASVERSVPNDGFAQRFAEAIDGEEFCLYYQPLVNAHDGGLSGFAALLRWQTDRGLLRPSQFLDIVNRVGLLPRLGAWVMETAARQLAQWRAQGLDYLTMSVHLDGSLLSQRDCLDRIGELLHRYDLPGNALEFEVPESALATDAHRVREALVGLRAMGASLTVQDFGLGGLSFAALAQYPLDRLKIDRSFIRNVSSDPRSAAIVRGIIAMGHQLGMKVIAKGVENEAELGFLRRNHCDFFQGYLFSPSLPAEKLGELVRKRFLLPSAFAATRPERTLLLVDDEENVLRSLVRLFRRDGYQILTANSVREAFDLLASNSAQVILSDQRMADMSGTEFLTRVRDLYPDTIRIVLSGYTDLATITDAINRGAIYRFLTKPWNDEELREHILDAFRAYERRAAGETGY